MGNSSTGKPLRVGLIGRAAVWKSDLFRLMQVTKDKWWYPFVDVDERLLKEAALIQLRHIFRKAPRTIGIIENACEKVLDIVLILAPLIIACPTGHRGLNRVPCIRSKPISVDVVRAKLWRQRKKI